MFPNFLIIGAQKSASTFVHECIREHPDVFMPRDEVAFFQDPDYLEGSLARFEALFASVKSEKAIGIKCPDYLGRPECPERIYKHIPDAKLIVVLRDPVERAISAYYWFMQVGIIPVRPLELGMKDLIDGRYDHQFPRSREIIDYGFYYEHLMRYLKYFDRERILILLQTDLKNFPRQIVSQIYRFLEIDDGYLPKALTRQPKQSVYSLPRLKWLAIANHFFYTYRVDENNMMALHLVENKLSRLCYYLMNGVDRYFLSFVFGNFKDKLSEDIRRAFVEKYKTDVEALEKMLGQELTKWK
ncbi:MAG: sulfotransferase [Anaerolineales bacterium]|nr:sulfotransferase [Anaerolineales bacterium]MCL4261529.1 sulfotransferase [Anaerolineales bacterium]